MPLETSDFFFLRPNLLVRNSTFCPTNVNICFTWVEEQTSINFLCNFNLLVIITESVCVYSAVRDEYLNIIQVCLSI